MRTALKATGSVAAGFVLAEAVMMGLEWLNGRVLYPELAKAAEGVTDQEAVRRIFAAAPLGSLLVVVAACGLGGLAGGWLTARLARPLPRPGPGPGGPPHPGGRGQQPHAAPAPLVLDRHAARPARGHPPGRGPGPPQVARGDGPARWPRPPEGLSSASAIAMRGRPT